MPVNNYLLSFLFGIRIREEIMNFLISKSKKSFGRFRKGLLITVGTITFCLVLNGSMHSMFENMEMNTIRNLNKIIMVYANRMFVYQNG